MRAATVPAHPMHADTLPITRVCETCYQRYTASLAVARQVTIPICAACLKAEQMEYELEYHLERHFGPDAHEEMDG